MMLEGEALELPAVQTSRRVADFVALTKPRVMAMVLVTTAVGFYVGAPAGPFDYVGLLACLLGTALAAGGTLALNQYLECDLDARMHRTRTRPIPDGRVAPLDALAFGVALTVAGLLFLAATVDFLAVLVTAATSVSYLFAYTPLKPRTSLCSVVGAIPGALPPLTGWAAASGSLGIGAWILFAIMFLWQIPHALAIGQLYREDYARAGIRLLPVIDPDGGSTARHIVSNSFALLAVALLPTLIGMAGPLYFTVALTLGLLLLGTALRLARSGAAADARRLLIASLVYLPFLLGTMAADKIVTLPW